MFLSSGATPQGIAVPLGLSASSYYTTLWFASRWVTVQTPHQAGIGETGASPNGHGG